MLLGKVGTKVPLFVSDHILTCRVTVLHDHRYTVTEDDVAVSAD